MKELDMSELLSPDCRDGNHGKCDGVAWDEEKDEPTGCTCKECDQ